MWRLSVKPNTVQSKWPNYDLMVELIGTDLKYINISMSTAATKSQSSVLWIKHVPVGTALSPQAVVSYQLIKLEKASNQGHF